MTHFHAYPMQLKPIYKQSLWGGNRIPIHYLREQAPKQCSESWELSDRLEDQSLIINGPYKEKTLTELIHAHSKEIGLEKAEKFPLLIKLIDAAKSLSIQVHPDDDLALQIKTEAKSEVWHILEAEKGSQIYLGLNQKFSDQALIEAIENNHLSSFMNAIEVEKGQTYYVPAGLMHSIGAGCLIFEVQQNSDTTYRLYDWGRIDQNNQKRELHLDLGLKALKQNHLHWGLCKNEVLKKTEQLTIMQLAKTPYFTLRRYHFDQMFSQEPKEYCAHYFVTEGSFDLIHQDQSYALKKGESFLVPKLQENLIFKPIENQICEMIESVAL